MCIGDEDLSCKRINTFITIIWTQSCLLLSDEVCLKEIATTIWCQKWDSLDVTSGPDSGRRLITLELKVPTLPRKKDSETRDRFRCWDRRDRPLESKRTQVAQSDISGKSQLNSV